ncbi:GNAT family N-acetyltransferase [Spirosoma montaniterrae]|uniref:N-acetyltransferase domain-containing protein n=1 Tax=Spirosoma montaniterrae TaxID=1178516 RepID=A0A1P9WT69_9BACT|nr:GNAT family N-acetyltransferase [Spirosoma montaniterrae]AQG78558.1 hypothetical protein AWR27_03895 [Spirosoma montaniterrae]
MVSKHLQTIQLITPGQAPALSALCRRIYPQYFTYLWFDEGAWYIEHSYNEATLRAELKDPNVQYFFTLLNDQPAGYLKVKLSSNLNNEAGGFEIERIYFLREVAGQGLGTYLIEYAFEIARQLNKRYVWLNVMDSSTNSIAFYHRHGFEPVGETWLGYKLMKPEYRRMWQMQRKIV